MTTHRLQASGCSHLQGLLWGRGEGCFLRPTNPRLSEHKKANRADIVAPPIAEGADGWQHGNVVQARLPDGNRARFVIGAPWTKRTLLAKGPFSFHGVPGLRHMLDAHPGKRKLAIRVCQPAALDA
jgi:hypothetical protein